MNVYINTINISELNMKFFKRLCRIFKDCNGSGTGTGCHKVKSIKLVRKHKDVIGVGFHRSGWPYVYKWLHTISSSRGILLDDFIEQNFCYRDKSLVYTKPWVGIFHHPPTIPYFGNDRERLENVFKSKEFIESAKNLKLAIALSEHLGDYLKKHLQCPIVVLKHPADVPDEKWTIEKYTKNHRKKLIQVGYYLRNTQLINQIRPSSFEKIRLWIRKNWIEEFDKRVKNYWRMRGDRREYGDYKSLIFVTPNQYDKLLCENIVVQEVFDASASNGILDCIVRNTPLIVNKHPAVVEYLGENYPLYFEHPDDILKLVNSNKILEAHQYLSKMDKSWLSGEQFVKDILKAIQLT